MTTDAFKLSIHRADGPYQLRNLPDEWRITDSIGPFTYGPDEIMSRSNYEAIMKELRGLEGVVEGNLVSTGYPDYRDSVEPDNADWFEFSGHIAWRSTLTNEQYWQKRKEGWSECEQEFPVLDKLMELNAQLENYPVLDENDYDERQIEAEIEAIKSERYTVNCEIDDERAGTILAYLEGYGDTQPPDRYHVDFYGDDYSIGQHGSYAGVYLSDCVRHACYVLGYLPIHKHNEYWRKRAKVPYRTKTRNLVYSWFGGRLPVAAIRYATKRFGVDAVANARQQARERKAAA